MNLDTICKRQTARFLTHLRDSGQSSERLERDFLRMMQFLFEDIRHFQGQSTENDNGQQEPR